MQESQNGFRKRRSMQDLIFVLRQMSEKLIRKGKEINVCFIALKKRWMYGSV